MLGSCFSWGCSLGNLFSVVCFHSDGCEADEAPPRLPPAHVLAGRRGVRMPCMAIVYGGRGVSEDFSQRCDLAAGSYWLPALMLSSAVDFGFCCYVSLLTSLGATAVALYILFWCCWPVLLPPRARLGHARCLTPRCVASLGRNEVNTPVRRDDLFRVQRD